MSTSISGELIASSIAASERSSRSLSPSPIIATPPPFMIVLMSLKSRFTSPGFVITSVIPLIARISTSSATLNAAFRARRGTSSRSLSFGITTTVSAKLRSFSRPNSAFSARIAPSARNGKVHIAIVRAPASFASCATTGAICTFPFRAEGAIRAENAEFGLEKLRSFADTVVVIPNDKLLELVPRLALNAAFKVADDVLMRAIKGITEVITKPGLVNLDFNDIKTIMKGGGVAMIGLGESDRDDRSEAEKVSEIVQGRIAANARIIWGAAVDPSLEHKLRVMLILTGVKSKQIRGPGEHLRAPQAGVDIVR